MILRSFVCAPATFFYIRFMIWILIQIVIIFYSSLTSILHFVNRLTFTRHFNRIEYVLLNGVLKKFCYRRMLQYVEYTNMLYTVSRTLKWFHSFFNFSHYKMTNYEIFERKVYLLFIIAAASISYHRWYKNILNIVNYTQEMKHPQFSTFVFDYFSFFFFLQTKMGKNRCCSFLFERFHWLDSSKNMNSSGL